jgi:hypothetical protein
MTGDPSSELQQYLHFEGHPSVGMSMMWKGFFITLFFPLYGIFVFIRQGRLKGVRKVQSCGLQSKKSNKKKGIS